MFLSDRSSPLLLTLIVEKRDIEHGGGRGGRYEGLEVSVVRWELIVAGFSFCF